MYNSILQYSTSQYIILYSIVLYYITLYHMILYFIIILHYSIVQYSIVQYSIVWSGLVQSSLVQSSLVQYSIVQYSTVQHIIVYYIIVYYIMLQHAGAFSLQPRWGESMLGQSFSSFLGDGAFEISTKATLKSGAGREAGWHGGSARKSLSVEGNPLLLQKDIPYYTRPSLTVEADMQASQPASEEPGAGSAKKT